MKHTIYNGIENLTKKEITTARAAEKRAVSAELANFANEKGIRFWDSENDYKVYFEE